MLKEGSSFSSFIDCSSASISSSFALSEVVGFVLGNSKFRLNIGVKVDEEELCSVSSLGLDWLSLFLMNSKVGARSWQLWSNSG